MTDTAEIAIHRGLKEVYFDRSETCFIDGRAGKLQYRGYSIDDLASRSTFEETAYLLLHGELPSRAQLDAFDAELKAARALPGEVIDVIRLVRDAHPMDVLRTAVSALAATDPETADKSHEATLRKGMRLTSQVPTIVMAHHAIREGRDPVEPSAALSHAANFLHMLDGEEPSADAAALMDKDFILHAEHGSNASSFTARVVTGTQADLHGSVTAAIAALSRPLARRGGGERDADGARDRRTGARRRLREGAAVARRADHGLRPPRLPRRGPARPPPARGACGGSAPRRASRSGTPSSRRCRRRCARTAASA